MTLASDLVSPPSLEAASLPVWPSPKHIPGPGLGEEGPGSGPGLRLASGSPGQAPIFDSHHSLKAGGPRPAFSSWAPPCSMAEPLVDVLSLLSRTERAGGSLGLGPSSVPPVWTGVSCCCLRWSICPESLHSYQPSRGWAMGVRAATVPGVCISPSLHTGRKELHSLASTPLEDFTPLYPPIFSGHPRPQVR